MSIPSDATMKVLLGEKSKKRKNLLTSESKSFFISNSAFIFTKNLNIKKILG